MSHYHDKLAAHELWEFLRVPGSEVTCCMESGRFMNIYEKRR